MIAFTLDQLARLAVWYLNWYHDWSYETWCARLEHDAPERTDR